jgi:hypothetical protein
MTIPAPTQVPDWQVSVVVHALPSPQTDPSALGGREHRPVAGSQVPASSHWSVPTQIVWLAPWQTPPRQRSPDVHALLSLHADPSALAVAGFEQPPVAGSHVPAM